MDSMEANLYEEDLFSAIFDPTKDEFSANQTFYPSFKASNAVDLDLGLSPLEEESCKEIREGGNPEEDEGFEDFIEEDLADALQKDSDPTLADSGSLASECQPGPLELYFPSSETEEMLVSNKPFTSVATPNPEEILDFDQGVAMEGDHHPRHSSVFSECEVFDLPFSSPPPVTNSMSTFDPINSPHFVPSSNTSFPYSAVPQPTIASFGQQSMVTPSVSMNTGIQNSELDFVISMIQSSGTNEQPTNTYPQSSNSQYNSTATIPIDTTNGMELLNILNSSVPEETYNSDFNMFPTSLMSTITNNELGNKPITTTNVQQQPIQLPLNGIVKSHVNNGCRSPRYSESSSYSDTRQRSPTPSRSSMAPSPVSSIATDFSDLDCGKDGGSSGNGQDPSSKKEIVNMPFYEFKKILDSPSVSERDKEEVKIIRKRGKNKVAAKHCRQRKLEVIMGLQQEVEKLKGFKAQLMMRSLSLQKAIEENKKRVARHTIPPNNRNNFNSGLIH